MDTCSALQVRNPADGSPLVSSSHTGQASSRQEWWPGLASPFAFLLARAEAVESFGEGPWWRRGYKHGTLCRLQAVRSWIGEDSQVDGGVFSAVVVMLLLLLLLRSSYSSTSRHSDGREFMDHQHFP